MVDKNARGRKLIERQGMAPDDDRTQTHVVLGKGTKVSHYTIVSKIGAGGMGEVYLAEDTKLNRKVALKFLPPHLCQDEDCRKRFTREAQAAAGLDHPNIAAIYEVGEFQDRPFYAMQIVEGQSLKDVIAGKDLPIDRILEIGIQACEGLQAAHEKGIIHRDIKPSNILLDGHGRVRIVDFGLATVSGSEHLTKTGSTLGTIGYMSPEQVQGREIDQRSDLFSLGVVLYELITKQNPFRRDSEAATLKAVSDDSPHPVARFRAGVPDGVQTIIEKALEKDVSTRFQTAGGMLADLTRLKRSMDSGESTVSALTPVRRLPRVWLAAAFVVVAAVVVFAVWVSRDRSYQFMMTHRQVTYFGDVDKCQISPDGSRYAFSRIVNGRYHLYVSELSGSKPVELLTYPRIASFRWSPDGQELAVAYRSDSSNQGCIVVPWLGGSTRKVDNLNGYNLNVAWSPDGKRLAEQTSIESADSFYVVDMHSQKRNTFSSKIDLKFCNDLDWSPMDKWILMTTYETSNDALWALPLDGSEPVELVSGEIPTARWGPNGNTVYFVNQSEVSGGIWATKFDAKSARQKIEPRSLLPGIKASNLSISRDGYKMMYARMDISSNLWRLNLNINAERSVEQLTLGTARLNHPAISPDGKRIVYTVFKDGRADIYLLSLDNSEPTRLTFDGVLNLWPCWSPDGNELAFVYSSNDEDFRIKTMNITSGQSHLYEMAVASRGSIPHWGVDGTIYFRIPGNRNITILDMETGVQQELLSESEESEGWIFSPSESPDVEWLAVYWNNHEIGTWGVCLISLIDPSVKRWISEGKLFNPVRWSPDGQWLYCSKEHLIIRINCTDNRQDTLATLPFPVEVQGIPQDWIIEPDISPDFSFVICGQVEFKQDAWLVENFDPARE
jgi:Tol biopolymer transport system component/predicted Ser/Thr protein kinase